MAKSKVTKKKVKIVGTQQYVNQNTGEIEDFQVISMEDRDFNFDKIWFAHIVEALDMIGNKKMKVLQYIIENKTRDNLFIMTQRKMSEELDISIKTVSVTMKALQDADFIHQIQSGTYRINPDKVFKGSHNARMNVLLQYCKEKGEE